MLHASACRIQYPTPSLPPSAPATPQLAAIFAHSVVACNALKSVVSCSQEIVLYGFWRMRMLHNVGRDSVAKVRLGPKNIARLLGQRCLIGQAIRKQQIANS